MMKVLLFREFENMIITKDFVLKLYGLGGLALAFIMWLLGPHVLDLVKYETMYWMVAIIGLVLTAGKVTESLEKDTENSRETFLQTLPVKRHVFAQAKFISFFLLNVFTFVWIAILFLLLMFLNGWHTAHWEMPPVVISMAFFVSGISLLMHYVIGKYRNVIFYTSLIIWAVIFGLSGLFAHVIMISFMAFSYLGLAASVIIYFICWVAAVLRVIKKGIPSKS